MSVLLLAFAAAYLAMTLLCLTMSRHRGALLRADTRLPGKPVLRLLAAGCFGFALWLCVNSQGGEIGTVVWLCLVMLAGMLLVLLLAWRSRWVLPVVPLLAACGALQGLL
ncbi:DUF3325 domain-containing protein [Stutzerimonas nosocomialis]|uniref:DUF3325 domain-containing protein n=1 Tax=Stutzerimonas nosocomialis TaxID=1056496 RepID=A0A5R9QCC0_9GAMM|nr:DUF3325 domain-containing protein [Stutzerimonas nosocomialis]TLX53600.1 DUF3325 domain-containing protein [Stutzerimonas nosocomialis]TLX55593.1 DUF3325 domain-containing protein [Stutzerimonas nosocomialis]TLX62777.1 DUF3325 domain-containing protein [Stutzerimonas nosocomialis]